MLKIKTDSISESVLQSKLEAENTSNEKGFVMIFDDILKSDRRFEVDFSQVAVTESIESVKSVTSPSLEEVTKDHCVNLQIHNQ